MLVAVVIEIPHAPKLQPGLGVAFGVEIHHLGPVCGDVGYEGNVMGLRHGMVDGDEMLVLHVLDGHRMVIVCFFRFQGGQRDAAAADHSVSQRVDDIAADGADIELAPQHIGASILVDDLLAIHQLDDGDAQRLGQGLQKADIRKSFGGLPLGDGLTADTDPLSQLRLGHVSGFPKLFYGGSGHVGVHGCHFLSEKSIPRNQSGSNLRFVDKVLILWYGTDDERWDGMDRYDDPEYYSVYAAPSPVPSVTHLSFNINYICFPVPCSDPQ